MCATPYDVLCQQELELHEFAKQYTTVLNSNIKLEESPVAGTHTHTHTRGTQPMDSHPQIRYGTCNSELI